MAHILITLRCCLLSPFFFQTFRPSPSFSFPQSSSCRVSSTNAPGGSGGNSTSSNSSSCFSFFFGTSSPAASTSISRIASSSSSNACVSISLSSLSIELNPLFGIGGGRLTRGLSAPSSTTSCGFHPRSALGVAKISSLFFPDTSAIFLFLGVENAGETETRSPPDSVGVPSPATERFAERGGVDSTSMKLSKIPRTLPVFWGVGPTWSRRPKRRCRRMLSGDSYISPLDQGLAEAFLVGVSVSAVGEGRPGTGGAGCSTASAFVGAFFLSVEEEEPERRRAYSLYFAATRGSVRTNSWKEGD